MHDSLQLQFFREENPMSTLDMSFHSQSCSMFPSTQVLVESVYILDKVNIHKLDLLQPSFPPIDNIWAIMAVWR